MRMQNERLFKLTDLQNGHAGTATGLITGAEAIERLDTISYI